MVYRRWGMSRVALALVVLGGASALLVASCKLGRQDEQTGRELPPPEPSAAVQPIKPTEVEPVAAPRNRDTPRPRAEPQPATGEPAAPKAATPSPAAPSDPTGTATATAAPPAPTTPQAGSAGAPVALNANCLPKCQSSLQACISKPIPLDAGAPSVEALSECRKAFEDCRAACAP